MVISQCQIHHRSRQNLISYTHRSIHNVMHAQNGALGRVQNRGSHHGSKHTSIRNGKGTPCHLFHRDLSLFSLLGQRNQIFFDIGKRLGFDVTEYWDHKTIGGGDSYRDIDIISIYYFFSVDDCVYYGLFL